MSTDEEDDNILARWSKRKRAVAEETVEEAGNSLESVTESSEERQAELTANREAAESIDLDTIDGDSDLSLFMKDGVPEALKRKALSLLWRSNPVFANLDGLNDYDENFADPNLIMKSFTSAYQVGRGYLKEIEEDLPVGDEMPDEGVTETASAEVQSDDGDPEQSEEPSEDEAIVDDASADFLEVQEQDALPKVSLRSRLNLDG